MVNIWLHYGAGLYKYKEEKQMKKRVLCLVIAMVLAASMTACGLLFGSDSPSYMSQKDFESYLGEPIEITTDNWDEYFNVLVDQWARSDVQQMETESGLPEAAICIYEKPGYIVYEADGSEVTGGWSTYSIRLKEGYYVYPDSVSVTHHRQIWDGTQYNEYTITNSKRFASLGGDRVSISEFKEAQGTIIKVEIPEEYIEDGNCVYIKNGEEVIEFNLQ